MDHKYPLGEIPELSFQKIAKNDPLRREYRAPFGAQVLEDTIRFRLWAPKASDVKLSLDSGGRQRLLTMNALERGWFELQTRDAKPGDLYRYVINGKLEIPDPASRFNPFDVHGPSQIIDPRGFEWADSEWRGRPWQEAVIYELHVGTFTAEGTFEGVMERLDYLAGLGITAIELMPVSDFPGSRNWGYDGVLPYAPDSSYGHPEDLKRLVQAAHQRDLMVLLDVVYNHFGPEGNYLGAYAPEFFTARHKTPWGDAINFEGPDSRTVRDFFIHNALYWLEEYNFDGLRLDAVHAIFDCSQHHILTEIAEAVRHGPGRRRYCHLVLENHQNNSGWLEHDDSGAPLLFNAQWNDDCHHAMHVLATGEQDGYYSDYSDKPVWYLGRCLAEGFAYQGEPSKFHGGVRRGEPSSALPLTAFISFLQNHDQTGNRALGERINVIAGPGVLRIMTSILLLSPSLPLLFMGEEFACERPFLFFCDFDRELAEAVTHGRRQEFAKFAQFSGKNQLRIPDPGDEASFIQSKLDWAVLTEPGPGKSIDFHRHLLEIRRSRIVPLLEKSPYGDSSFEVIGDRGLQVNWILGGGSRLQLWANLGPASLDIDFDPKGEVLYAEGEFPKPWSVIWSLD